MKFFFLVSVIATASALPQPLHCDKQFDYYDNYGHGFDITCHGITKEHLHLLSNITITNELSLTIGNSTLLNVTSDIFHHVHLAATNCRVNLLTKLEKNMFQTTPSLTTLDLSDNQINLDNNNFKGLTMLNTLLLKNNSITYLPNGVFNDLKSLHTLDLSLNKLQRLDDNSVFQSLRSLEVLNISFNLLEDINYDLLRPLNNLHVLDVSSNKLKNIQYDVILSNLPVLSVLNIKSNFLTCDFLYKVVTFLKKKNVSYTMAEKFDYDKENVAGIYCTNENHEMMNHSVGSLSGVDDDQGAKGGHVLVDFGLSVVILATLVCVGIGMFRFYVYLKRRKYRADEFELIDE